MKAAIVKPDGLIYVNEVPEEPKNCYNTSCSQWCVCPRMKDYQKALASAKESAILVSDQEHAKTLLQQLLGPTIPTNKVFMIPDLKWEVKIHCDEYHAHTKSTCKVAILTPLKPENKTMKNADKSAHPAPESEHRYDCVYKSGVIRNNLSFADINSVYKAVVEFIKWYNEQKKV